MLPVGGIGHRAQLCNGAAGVALGASIRNRRVAPALGSRAAAPLLTAQPAWLCLAPRHGSVLTRPRWQALTADATRLVNFWITCIALLIFLPFRLAISLPAI